MNKPSFDDCRQMIPRLVPQVVVVLIASVLLGAAYNHTSPLGVRSSSAVPVVESAIISSTAPVAAAPSGYINETLSMTLEAVPRMTPVARAAATPVANLPSALSQPSPPAPRTSVQLPNLTWTEVKPLLESQQITLIDARAAAQFQAGHIPGAISLPANNPSAELEAFAAKHPKAAPLVVYCGAGSCSLARNLAEKLVQQHGFSNVKVMPGGYTEYRLAMTQPAINP